jgi:hypothetical protein
MNDFEEYCITKKIDPVRFQSHDTVLWDSLKSLFDQVHPKSFTQQKLFIINNLRRTYLIPTVAIPKTPKTPLAPKAVVAPSIESPEILLNDETLLKPQEEAPKKPAFKPVFKKTVLENTAEITEGEPVAEKPKPAAVKPVMKKPAIQDKSSETQQDLTKTENLEEAPKPAKIVFKPVMKKPATQDNSSETQQDVTKTENLEEAPKPAKIVFKPVMKKKTD